MLNTLQVFLLLMGSSSWVFQHFPKVWQLREQFCFVFVCHTAPGSKGCWLKAFRKGGRQRRPFSDGGWEMQSLGDARTPGAGWWLWWPPRAPCCSGTWVQPMWDQLDTTDVPVAPGLGSELASSLSSWSSSQSQGSGEGFYSNSCHSLPILDVN